MDVSRRPMLVVCPHCVRANYPGAHFCRFCVTPLTSHAATDPLRSIYAEMDTLGKASRSPRNVVVLAGMWLILGPSFLVALFMLMFVAWRGLFGIELAPGRSAPDVTIFGLSMLTLPSLAVGVAAVFGMLLFRTTRNYFRMRHERGLEVPEEEGPDDLSEMPDSPSAPDSPQP